MGRSCSFPADLWVLYCFTRLENGCLQLILSFVFATVLDYSAEVLNHYPGEFLILFLSCFPMLLSYTNSSASGMGVEIQVCSIQTFPCVCIFENFHKKDEEKQNKLEFLLLSVHTSNVSLYPVMVIWVHKVLLIRDFICPSSY